MALFKQSDLHFAEGFSRLLARNPFLPEWIEQERELLGSDFEPAQRVYSWQPGWGLSHYHPNLAAIGDRVDELTERTRARFAWGQPAEENDLLLYEALAFYHLYRRFAPDLDEWIEAALHGRGGTLPSGLWDQFTARYQELFHLPGLQFPSAHTADHLLACFFQLRRGMYHIFHNIAGSSGPCARLRAAVWQSIVTHDMKRWSRSLYRGMTDFPTLITGPSGTGKELVAQAIGRSLYIPFDPKKQEFTADFTRAFLPLNVAALAPTLVESELFGHAAGSFTGAVGDRRGWLDQCGPHGAVFLDEIGDLESSLQVKLLRVLQERKFQPTGSTEDREFAGKIIAATNRDLAAEMQAGRFREDLYYRLCADRITTPSLREQLAEAPDDLRFMVLFIARKVVPPEEADDLAEEVEGWINRHPVLGVTYPWPGNFRELEQCVRSYVIRKDYQPLLHPRTDDARGAFETLVELVVSGEMSAAQLERRLYTLVHQRCGSLVEAARCLGCDWRTLRSRIENEEAASPK